MGVIATAISASAPLSGQDHRSGPNFQLFADDGTTVTVSAPAGIVFDIKQDKTMAHDPTPVSNATNGTTFPGNTLTKDNNYYIANPKHATGNFTVNLDQN